MTSSSFMILNTKYMQKIQKVTHLIKLHHCLFTHPHGCLVGTCDSLCQNWAPHSASPKPVSLTRPFLFLFYPVFKRKAFHPIVKDKISWNFLGFFFTFTIFVQSIKKFCQHPPQTLSESCFSVFFSLNCLHLEPSKSSLFSGFLQ